MSWCFPPFILLITSLNYFKLIISSGFVCVLCSGWVFLLAFFIFNVISIFSFEELLKIFSPSFIISFSSDIILPPLSLIFVRVVTFFVSYSSGCRKTFFGFLYRYASFILSPHFFQDSSFSFSTFLLTIFVVPYMVHNL